MLAVLVDWNVSVDRDDEGFAFDFDGGRFVAASRCYDLAFSGLRNSWSLDGDFDMEESIFNFCDHGLVFFESGSVPQFLTGQVSSFEKLLGSCYESGQELRAGL